MKSGVILLFFKKYFGVILAITIIVCAVGSLTIIKIVKISIRELRSIIRQAIIETGGGWASPPQPASGDSFNPDINRREALGRLESGTPIDDDLPSHLRDPQEDFEDDYGPVPPTKGDPYVSQDPYARDFSPLPTPSIKRL